jgi:hypothetical protein
MTQPDELERVDRRCQSAAVIAIAAAVVVTAIAMALFY